LPSFHKQKNDDLLFQIELTCLQFVYQGNDV